MNRKMIFNSILAVVTAITTLSSTASYAFSAQGNAANNIAETNLPHVFLDGESIPLDDERIENIVIIPAKSAVPIVQAVQPVNPTSAGVSLFAAASGGGSPNVSGIVSLSGEFSQDPDVKMDGTKVSARRYVVKIEGFDYEAYCADPKLRGPENDDAVYELAGEANSRLKNALKNGYPINSEWSNEDVDTNDRMFWVYVTRVAVAIANNPTRNFTGDTDVINKARQLANGGITANTNTYPPIMLNGVKDTQDTGRMIHESISQAQSETFEITHNRKTEFFYNPFRFEWAAGTPAGAKLIVGGSVIATAPTNPTTIFRGNTTAFQIEMPNTAEYDGKTAAVNLVGVHNQYADKIWLMQNPNNPDGFQDIVFYIPEVSASAEFSFVREEDEPEEAELRIVKHNSSGRGLAGAKFEITGPEGYSEQKTSPSNGIIKLTGLAPGEYTITEITPPSGHKLAEPASVTVTIEPDNPGIVERIFINEPTTTTTEPNLTSVKIQKIDALTRENIHGALIRLRGISSHQVVTEDGHIWEIDNTGINLSQVLTAGATTGGGDVTSTVSDGVWELEGLPYGAYIAEEERAPDNYSLLPQHTAYGFWVLPPNISIKANQDESQAVVDIQSAIDALLEAAIAAAEAAGEEEPDISALLEEIKQIISDMLAGMTLDVVFDIEEDTPTNSHLVTFENFPFGKIEVTKYDMVTGETLAGTHFRIQGYFAEGNTNGMPIDRMEVTGSDGKVVFDNLPAGQYTISEAEAPPGYQFDPNEFRSVSLTWGQTASTTFYNKPKTFVEVIKIDGDDSGLLLDGATFRLTDPTTGEIWEGTTSGGKVRLGEGGGSFGNQLVEEKLYILTEIQAPNGYVLDSSPIEVIVAVDNQLNIVTVRNFKKPTLTLIKYDELTNEPLAGATFRLWKTEGETWSENQVTDANGKIVWTDLDPGIYSLQEIDEPYGYFRDITRKEILLEGGDNKQLTFYNRPRPVLFIYKRDKITGEPLSGVKFLVQRLEGETIGEFLTDENGMIELSPRTGYLLEEKIYRVTELTPPDHYLLDEVNVKDVMLKWYEPTELIFENVLKPTLIFIKRNGLTGRGIDNATYKVEYEGASGGVANLGTYKTKCGLIVMPYVQPGWYILTETIPAPGYSLPTNPFQRMYLAPGQNSYTYAQTQTDLYVDQRTNPNSGTKGMCGDWCGYLCSQLCAGNCGNPGGGNMSGSTGGGFGNITITNGKGDPLGNGNGGTATPTNPPTDTSRPMLTAITVTRNSDMTATVQFTSSAAGKYYYSVANSGASEPFVVTSGVGAACSAGSNTITVYMTAGAKDVYIKVKDANGNDALKIAVPAYSATTPATNPASNTENLPDFSNMVITGGTVVYKNPDFPGITITFGS